MRALLIAPLFVCIASAAETSGEPETVRQRAEEATLYDGGAAAHRDLAAISEDPEQKRAALETAFFLALRDGDIATAREVQTESGQADLAWWIPAAGADEGEAVAIPGGLRALAAVARSKTGVSSEDFFEHYCRTVARASLYANEEATKQQFDRIRRYFAFLTDLRAFQDAPAEDAIVITLSAGDKDALKRARRVVDLLGWNLKSSKRGVELAPGESERHGFGQEYAAALAIDQVQMQDALTGGGEFVLRVVIEPAQVLLGEQAWRESFYAGTAYAGGFAEAVLSEPRMAEAYVGLSEMSPRAVGPLLSGVGLERLVKRYSLALQLFSAALVVGPEGVSAPGGADAHDEWFNMVGAPPSDPDAFFPALLKKDDGRLLAFYSTLSQLDMPRQRFLTESSRRTRAFYEAYSDTPEMADGARRMVRGNSFGEFLRELPLAPDGSLHFPGSPEIWQVAKGDADVRKLQKRMKRASPEEEDQILLRLMKTRFDTGTGQLSQMEKFLSAMRIDRVRETPLDPIAALLIAQNLATLGAVYPYFSSLTALEAEHLQAFLAVARRAEQGDPVEKNQFLGLFHSMAALTMLAEERKALSPPEAARLFAEMCQGLAHAPGPDGQVRASLDFARALPAAAKTEGRDADDKLARMLLGDPEGPFGFRHAQGMRVKELQQVPPLWKLLEMYDAITALEAGPDGAQAHIDALRTAILTLPDVAIPKDMDVRGELKRSLEAFSASELLNDLARIAKAAGKKKVKAEDVKAEAGRLLGAMRPIVMLALAGEVYSVYLRPDDLLVANDPLLLRKHHFFDLESTQLADDFTMSTLEASSGSTGSWVNGGFAGFASTAGQIGLVNARSHQGNAAAYIQAALGSLRASDWRRTSDQHVRYAALRILTAKDWAVRAAKDEESRTALGEAMYGLVAAGRRSMALRAIENRRWEQLWDLLTLSDLYFLGGRAESDSLGDSAVFAALKQVETAIDGAGMQPFGAVHREMWDQSSPRLEPAAPYEVFERILSTALIAERTAEWALQAAWAADCKRWSLAQLADRLEDAALATTTQAAPSNLHDWSSVLTSYEQHTAAALEEAMER